MEKLTTILQAVDNAAVTVELLQDIEGVFVGALNVYNAETLALLTVFIAGMREGMKND